MKNKIPMLFIWVLNIQGYRFMKLKLVLVLFLISGLSYAAGTACIVKGGGILDGLLMQFGNVTNQWQDVINPLTKKIFFILFGMEFMWQLTVKKVFAGDVEKLWVFFFTRTVLCFFFAKYLVNIALYRDVIMYFTELGSKLGGFSLNIHGGSIATLGPSEVMSNFSCLADMIHTATDQSGTISFIAVKLTLAIIQVLLFLTLIFIAFYLMRIVLQAYLIIYIGFLFAGFAGSSWTFAYWQRYLSAVIAVGIKLFIVCLIMGVLNGEMKSWANDINRATEQGLDILMGVILHVFGTSVIIALSIWQLPEWFAATVTGQLSTGLANPLERILSTISSQSQLLQNMGKFVHAENSKSSGKETASAIHKLASANLGRSVPATSKESNIKSKLANLNPFTKES